MYALLRGSGSIATLRILLNPAHVDLALSRTVDYARTVARHCGPPTDPDPSVAIDAA